jgi:hypothetical protein
MGGRGLNANWGEDKEDKEGKEGKEGKEDLEI